MLPIMETLTLSSAVSQNNQTLHVAVAEGKFTFFSKRAPIEFGTCELLKFYVFENVRL